MLSLSSVSTFTYLSDFQRCGQPFLHKIVSFYQSFHSLSCCYSVLLFKRALSIKCYFIICMLLHLGEATVHFLAFCTFRVSVLFLFQPTPLHIFHLCVCVCVCLCVCDSMSLKNWPYEPPSVSQLQDFLLADRRPTGHINEVWPNLYIGNR